MRCPHCGQSQSRVIETRDSDEAIRRRRECEACQLRFTTYERPQFPRLIVRAVSGAQRNFTRGWLASALRAAGADLPEATLNTIVGGIDAQLRAGTRRVVTTADVAAMAAREVSQSGRRSASGAGRPTAAEVTAALEASLPHRRQGPSQLRLPMEGR